MLYFVAKQVNLFSSRLRQRDANHLSNQFSMIKMGK